MDEKQPSGCPCGRGVPYPDCCGRFLSREEHALRAEDLMRSRYSAYVIGDIDYILETHHPTTRSSTDRTSAARWSRQSEWRGLEILATEKGEPTDEEGVVEFRARYSMEGAVYIHHERSTFRKTNGRWYYVEGEMGKPARSVRTGPKIGRNDPCPCGSGKKHKKCCGK